MTKGYRYTDRNGIISKEATNCPDGYYTSPVKAIKQMMSQYIELEDRCKSKIKTAARALNSLEKELKHAK